MSDSPDAMRKRNIALARPLRSWTTRSDMGGSPHPGPLPRWGRGPHFEPRLASNEARAEIMRGRSSVSRSRAELPHLVVGGEHLLAGNVFVIDHDPDAALAVELGRAHPRAHGRLAVRGAEGDGADGRLDLEALEGLDELGC